MMRLEPSSQSRQLAGQLILPNWSPRFGTDPERWPFAGYIFHRNDLTPGVTSTRRLLADLYGVYRRMYGHSPLLALTEEGGTVHRFPTLPPPPSALLSGKLTPDDIRVIGRLTARMLAMQGFNWNLAPVLDWYLPGNEVIGTRSFGNGRGMLNAAKTWIQGHQSVGIPVTVKHFPGHGHAFEDSHIKAPIIERHDQSWRNEVKAFAEFLSGSSVDGVMTAHVRFLEVDQNPVTLSSHWMQEILRESLKFNGVIITDALSMQAIRQVSSPPEAAVKALSAGVDLVDCGGDEGVAIDILKSVAQAIDSQIISPKRIQDSLNRINRLKDSTLSMDAWPVILAAQDFYDQFIRFVTKGAQIRGNTSNFSLESPRVWIGSSHQIQVEERRGAEGLFIRADMNDPRAWRRLSQIKSGQLVIFTENTWKSPWATNQLNALCMTKDVLHVAVQDPLDAYRTRGSRAMIFLRGNPYYAESAVTAILGP